MFKKTQKILSFFLIGTLLLGNLSLGYDSDLFVGGSPSDGFVYSGEEEYGVISDQYLTGQTDGHGSYEVRSEPLVKYFPKYLGKGHLKKGKSLDSIAFYRDDKGRIYADSVESLLGKDNFEKWLSLTNNSIPLVYGVNDPTNVSQAKEILDGQRFTTRPIIKNNEGRVLLYWKKMKDGSYQMFDYINSKNPKNVSALNEGKGLPENYRKVFVIGMRSVLHGNGQLNFHTRGKFNNFGYLKRDINRNNGTGAPKIGTNSGFDALAFYINSGTYGRFGKGHGQSAAYVGRGHGLYFKNKPQPGMDLLSMQRGFRPQLIWALPYIKLHVGKGKLTTFNTAFYQPNTGESQIFTHKSNATLFSQGEMAIDGRFAESNTKDEQGYQTKYQGPGYYPEASLIGKSQGEGGLTWGNTLYRLGGGKFQNHDLAGMVYRTDNRYSYFVDVGFCGDGLTQTYAGEKCDWGPSNGEGAPCSETCQPQENLCGNGKIDIVKKADGSIDQDKSEECDWKMFEGKPVDMSILPTWLHGQTGLTYTGKNNPCYKPDEKSEYEAVGRKACQWKKPYGIIELTNKDGMIKNGSDVRDISLSDLPVWANITSCQWYKLSTANKYGDKKYEIPYIYTYPYISQTILPLIKGTMTLEQAKILRGLDGICKMDLYKTDYITRILVGKSVKETTPSNLYKEWGNIYVSQLFKNDKIQVGSQLTNNVAVKYGYNPHHKNINTYINDEPKKRNDLNPGLISCKKFTSREVAPNQYEITMNISQFNPASGQLISLLRPANNDILTNPNNRISLTIMGSTKINNDQINKYHGKKALLPVITKDEVAKFTLQYKTDKGITNEICEYKLKYKPDNCDISHIKNEKNNPSGKTLFDANIGIYSL